MDGCGIIIPSQDIFLPDEEVISRIELNKAYKFIYKNKISSGILIGKGSLQQCQEITDMLSQCYRSKAKKNSCEDVFS